jgi:hypothetical protein
VERLKLAAEVGRLERESNALARSIVDTTTELKVAIATRDAERVASPNAPAPEPKPSMADIRRDAQTQWLALIAEQGRAERQAAARDSMSSLDLGGNVAKAAASRTTAPTSETREQVQSQSLEDRAGHSAEANEAARPIPTKGTRHDDDHTL